MVSIYSLNGLFNNLTMSETIAENNKSVKNNKNNKNKIKKI